MSYVNKINFGTLLQSTQAQTLKKETLNIIIRSILESMAEENVNSLILTRIVNTQGLESLLRRLEYCKNIALYNFLNVSSDVQRNISDAEFILVTSPRFSACLIWSNKKTHSSEFFQVYYLMNSKNIDEVFDVINKNGLKEINDIYHSYKPERRSNRILNIVINKITKSLNDTVEENHIKEIEQKEILSRDVMKSFREESYKNIRECCHEMKNQFSIIDVYSEILKKQFGDNKNLNIILKAIASINNLLSELKESQDYKMKKISFVETVKGACEIMEGALEKNKNKIIFNKNDTQGKEIFADLDKLQAVIINILKNANDFTHDDKIEVNLGINNKTAEIRIINHGEPIREEDKKSIFESGFTTRREGWGLGLNLCKKHLENQAGSIELVKSDSDSTEFLIKIQLVS